MREVIAITGYDLVARQLFERPQVIPMAGRVLRRYVKSVEMNAAIAAFDIFKNALFTVLSTSTLQRSQ
jgi:hypothetical protein